ncbi:class I SAM-dependent DNA methyltransferase [Stenotrophomonas rhizophila]|uniref:class I SAM-dependent DNA methyltransferase n=1 Tax=Stenotrophomonas rhizophila TaxID=216778 RepID=UPI001E608E84|nr:class I SAM-dependent methyltransferase [Stenotrophomonas rhizophila]MCC7633997.1 methyltransferase domain-containing protein [Stenotrophomonas rhizophila]MCC7663331.1 methyltransferase domain-containing protein [Stenotrophomonas rhizophila]
MSTAAYFDRLYQQPDPFQYRSRWYEARKRALTLACLPRQRYANAWELGCSNGVLTAELAARCDVLLGTDISSDALAQAAVSTREWPQVTLQCASHPEEWPTGRFDLIVVSEVGYYLATPVLALLARRLHGSLTDDGLLLACHWRHRFDQARSATADVHLLLQGDLVEAFAYQDEDLLLQAWSARPTSVARWEGLR